LAKYISVQASTILYKNVIISDKKISIFLSLLVKYTDTYLANNNTSGLHTVATVPLNTNKQIRLSDYSISKYDYVNYVMAGANNNIDITNFLPFYNIFEIAVGKSYDDTNVATIGTGAGTETAFKAQLSKFIVYHRDIMYQSFKDHTRYGIDQDFYASQRESFLTFNMRLQAAANDQTMQELMMMSQFPTMAITDAIPINSSMTIHYNFDIMPD